MSNSYYNAGSFPATGTPATSASMRAELALIAGGFDRLPTLSGNANKLVLVNGAETGMTVLTPPAGDLVGTTATQTLTNKTISGAFTGSLTGAASLNVLKTGDTMSGGLTYSPGAANGVAYLNASKVLTSGSNLTFDGTTLTMAANPVLSGGTASGVLYLNGSKVATSGSALTFDGTDFTATGKITGSNATTSFVTDATNGFALFSGDPINYNISRSSTTVSVKSGGPLSLNAGTTSPITFYAFGSEQMRLTSTGLGIGTSSPGTKLVVNGGASPARGIAAILSASVTGAQLQFTQGGVDDWAIGQPAGTSAFAFWAGRATGSDGTERMRLDSSGNLGIGTSSPGAKLHIDGSGLVTAKVSSSSGNPTLTLDATGINNADIYVNRSTSALVFYNYGADRLTLDSSGNLGIGTSSPSSAYSGVARVAMVAATGTTAVSLRVSSANASGELYSAGSVTEWGLYSASNSPFSIWTNNNKNLTLDSSGNLGLGVTPSAWYSGAKAFQFGGNAALLNNNFNSTIFVHNAFYDTTWRYILTGQQASYYNQLNGAHAWYTAPTGTAGNAISFTLAMTLTASNELLVGKTASTYGATNRSTFELNGSNDSIISLQYGGASGYYLQVNSTAGYLWNSANTPIVFGTNNTDRARITSGGDLLVGTTDAAQTSGAGFKVGGAGGAGVGQVAIVDADSTNSTVTYRLYSTGAAAYRFYVGLGGTIYATSATITSLSDQRLKENIQNIDVGLNAIMALKPRKFDWKAGKGKDIKGDRGFIAQEFEQVFPDMVDTWQDPAPEGEEPYKAVNADLIPVLVKAMQEQQALITTLTARVAQLERQA